MCIHLIDVMCKSETHSTCELLKICLQTMVDCFVQNANSRSAVCRSRRPDVNLSVLYTRISPQMLSYLQPSAAGLLTTSSARWASVYDHIFYVEFYNKLLHYYTHLVAYFFRTTWLSQYQKGKTSLDLNEARDDGVFGCSGISWTICKQSAPRSRHITTPTTHHSIFTGRMLFLMPNQQCQCTEGKCCFVLCFY